MGLTLCTILPQTILDGGKVAQHVHSDSKSTF